MITREIPLPELAMIAGTRVALGIGIGLLLANQLAPGRRTTMGKTLLTVGILSTIPLALGVLFGDRPAPRSKLLREPTGAEVMSSAL